MRFKGLGQKGWNYYRPQDLEFESANRLQDQQVGYVSREKINLKNLLFPFFIFLNYPRPIYISPPKSKHYNWRVNLPSWTDRQCRRQCPCPPRLYFSILFTIFSTNQFVFLELIILVLVKVWIWGKIFPWIKAKN